MTWSLPLIRGTQQLSLTGSPSHMSSRTTDCDGVTCHVVTRSRGGHYITLHYIPTIDLDGNEAAQCTLSCAQVTNQENTATAAETNGGFLNFKIMVLIINTKTGNGHTLALLPHCGLSLPLNTARHQPADRLTRHKMVCLVSLFVFNWVSILFCSSLIILITITLYLSLFKEVFNT